MPPQHEQDRLQAELTRLFGTRGFKGQFERRTKKDEPGMPDKEEFQRHIWKKD